MACVAREPRWQAQASLLSRPSPARNATVPSQRRPQAASELLLFFLVPSFTMMAFTSAVEPLRLANREAGRELYRWKLVSKDGLPVAASNGISVQVDAAMRDCEPMAGVRPAVVVCGGIGTERYQDRDVFAWLRRHDRHGAEIGALCTAAHALARAGLLDAPSLHDPLGEPAGAGRGLPRYRGHGRPVRDRPQALHLLRREPPPST